MIEALKKLKTEALLAIAAAKDAVALDELETQFLGRKNGQLTELVKGLKDVAHDAKKEVGALVNEVKNALEAEVSGRRREFAAAAWAQNALTEQLDITQPPLPASERGHLHPVTQVQRDLEDFFGELGFMVIGGPELESDYYNFTALNIPESHPARDAQDTFYIKGHSNWVMRTQTSNVQVRALQKYGAPLRVLVPGKCYRNESTDPRHEHTFYQAEGLVVDKNISFSHMKGVLEALAKHLYGEKTELRLRPKYYPFVEPGVNGEVTCFLCTGKGCRVCKHTGWLEIFGAGMVHPQVLKEGGIDPAQYQGFAFGLGLTRLVMLKYGIDDIRLLESGSMPFLQQF